MRREPEGPRVRAGTAYIFAFPFDVFHHAAGEPIETAFRERCVRVYPPFIDGTSNSESTKSVQLKHVPIIPGTTAPHVGASRVGALKVALSWAAGSVAANGLRIDVFGEEAPSLAAEFVDRLMELVRCFTFQWWITRDHRFDQTDLRNSFDMNERGERLAEVMSMATTVGRIGIERVLTRAAFADCVTQCGCGRRSPSSLVKLCDALYSFALGDDRRFVIDSAIACEVLLIEHGLRIAMNRGLAPGRVERSLEKPQFPVRLSGGMRSLLGRSYAAERPSQFEWLRALWIARNNVAHGKSLVTRHGGKTIRPTREQVTEIEKAVVDLFIWYQQFLPLAPVEA